MNYDVIIQDICNIITKQNQKEHIFAYAYIKQVFDMHNIEYHIENVLDITHKLSNLNLVTIDNIINRTNIISYVRKLKLKTII